MTTTTAIAVNSQQDYINSQKALESLGAVHIGNICSGQDVSADVILPYEKYKEICDRVGIPSKFLSIEKSPVVAFGRAWRAVKKPKGMKATEFKHSRKEDSPVILIGFYKETTTGTSVNDAELETQHEISLSFDKTNFSIECIPKSSEYIEDAQRLLEEVSGNYRKFANIISNDIQAMTVDFCKTMGIALQPRGGTYFIPKTHDGLVQSFQSLYEEISSNFVAIPSYSSPGGNASLGRTAAKSLISDLDAIDIEIFQMKLSTVRCEVLTKTVKQAIANISNRKILKDSLELVGRKSCPALKRMADELIKNFPNMGDSEIIEGLNTILSKIEIKESFRNSTLENRLREIKTLTTKIMDFQDFLGAESDNLTNSLEFLNDYIVSSYKSKNGGLLPPEELDIDFEPNKEVRFSEPQISTPEVLDPEPEVPVIAAIAEDIIEPEDITPIPEPEPETETTESDFIDINDGTDFD